MQVITTVLLSYKVLRVLLSPVKTKQTSFFSCKNLADQKERKWGGGGRFKELIYSSFLETRKNKETQLDSLSWSSAYLKNLGKTDITGYLLLNTYSVLAALYAVSTSHSKN